jgi:DNA polymerase-3 subunit epsilon
VRPPRGPDDRRLLFFDLETTGTDPESDRIVELAVVRPDEAEPTVRRYDPGRPIPPGATAVHGISDEDVADAPAFGEEAGRVQRLIEERVLCGYNIRSFDTVMLDLELRRAGQPGIDLDRVREVDLMRVWEEMEGGARRPDADGEAAGEPSGKGPGWTLSDAVRRYLARELEEAHSAAGDTRVLPELLDAMRSAHGLGLEEMLVLSRRPDEVDRAGKLRCGRGGTVVFAFGKHRGEPVAEHPDYAEWILGADFPRDTKRALRQVLDGT